MDTAAVFTQALVGSSPSEARFPAIPNDIPATACGEPDKSRERERERESYRSEMKTKNETKQVEISDRQTSFNKA